MKLHLTGRKPKDQKICRFDSAGCPESQTSGLRDVERLSVAFLPDHPSQLTLLWMRGYILELCLMIQGLRACLPTTTRGETSPAED